MDDTTTIGTVEAAALLGYTTDHIGLLARTGKLPARRISARVYLFERSDVEAFRATRRPPGRPRKAPVDDGRR